MSLTVDDLTTAERPRSRRLIYAFAVLLPIIVVAGASAWFFRSFILPPAITLPEPVAVSSADTAPRATPEPKPLAQKSASQETTGAATPPNSRVATAPNWPAPAPRASSAASSIWDSVPLPGPPRQMQRLMPETETAAAPPVTDPVPLPPRRPRLTTNGGDATIPLPRPRPTLASN